MQAIISASSASALLLDGESAALLFADGRRVAVNSPAAVFRFRYAEAHDAEFVEHTSEADALARLHLAQEESSALNLALLFLDREEERETRCEAAMELEELLAQPKIGEWVEAVLYARPFPAAVDTVEALSVCRATESGKVEQLLKNLCEFQPAIDRVHQAWRALPDTLFGDESDRAFALSAFIRTQTFRKLVLNITRGIPLGNTEVDAHLNPRLQRVTHRREITRAWFSALRPRETPVQPLASEEADWLEEEAETRSKKSRAPRKFSKGNPFHKVEAQKKAIQEAMRQRNFERVREYVRDLVDFHVANGDRDFAAKSLCDLAKHTKALGQYWLQLELALEATRVFPNDPQCHCQLADAMLANGQLPEALRLYEKTSRTYPENVFAKTGRAEVLKSLGRLEESLSSYDDTLSSHPENVVAKTGRAEVLKSLGRLSESLTSYDDTLRSHPENVFAKTGRAEVLKSLGRLEESLTSYDATLRSHPENVVAKSGRAEVLKSLGRLEESLTSYDDTLRLHPEDVVAKCGRAEVLKSLSRLPEALTAYDNILRSHPEDVFAKTGRAEVLKSLGSLNESLTAYDDILRSHPEDVVAKNGRAHLLGLMSRHEEALALLSVGKPRTRDEWVGFHIRGMILLRLERHGEALDVFETGVRNCPFAAHGRYFRTALAMARVQSGDFKIALELLGDGQSGDLEVPRKVLTVHSLGALGQQEAAAKLWDELPREKFNLPLFAPELKRRFVTSEPPEYDDAWLARQEWECFMLAA